MPVIFPELQRLLEYELPPAKRYRRFLSVVVLQFDPLADDCEESARQTLNKSMRCSDVICKWENAMALVLSETDKAGALTAMERWRGLMNGKGKFHSSVSSFPNDDQSAKGLMDTAGRRLQMALKMEDGAIVAEG